MLVLESLGEMIKLLETNGVVEFYRCLIVFGGVEELNCLTTKNS